MTAPSVRIAPSVLSADFAALGRDVAAVERGGADLIHVDVMDGHFVPNITMGTPVVKALRRVATRPLDVHLMIEQPDRYVEAFVQNGAAMVSVHVEAVPHLHRTLALIRSLGAQAGAVLNPATPASAIEDVARRPGLRGRDVRQPWLRRAVVHPVQPREDSPRADPADTRWRVGGRSRWTAAWTSATSRRSWKPARASWSPATPSSARPIAEAATRALRAAAERR